MNEIILVESSTMRNQYCVDQNVSILDRIGILQTLPHTGYATTEQVAAFYQVQVKTIRQLSWRNKDELFNDGYKVMTHKEFRELHDVDRKSHTRSIAVYPRKAVLRVGLLLRDSEVAIAVRTYLLDTEEKVTSTPHDKKALISMAQRLSTQAEKIGENARQLTNHADQLNQNANQLISQANITKALVDEMYRNREGIKNLDKRVSYLEQSKKAESSPIIKNLHSHGKIETEDCITPAQIKILQENVKQKGHPVKVWKKLNKFFQVTRYKFLPQDRFDEILTWLDSYQE